MDSWGISGEMDNMRGPVGQSLRTGDEVWEYWILKGGDESGVRSGDGSGGQSLCMVQVRSPLP